MKLISAIILIGFGLFQFKTCSKVKHKEKTDCAVKEQSCVNELVLGGPVTILISSREKKKA